MAKTGHISIEHLNFSFTPHYARDAFFHDISISFEQGKLHFIRGKNGSGKSTLFRLLQGTCYANEFLSGTVSLGQESYQLDNTHDQDILHENIRMVPQKFDLMLADQFSFKENLQLASLDKKPGLTALPLLGSIPSLVDRFEIDYEKPVHLLSGGQRQILAILMALETAPSVLLLDEPTAALDDKNAAMVMFFLKKLLEARPALTFLVICHDRELVEEYAQTHYYEIHVKPQGIREIIHHQL